MNQENENVIEAQESDYLYLNTSQITNAGQGLFTAIKIYKDETIAVFEGEVINNDKALERAKCNNDLYFINMLDGNILDCMTTFCFAKYANDALGKGNSIFKNNAKISLDENDNICLSATKNIKAGEEIFVAYGKKYWKKHG